MAGYIGVVEMIVLRVSVYKMSVVENIDVFKLMVDLLTIVYPELIM